MKTKRNPLGAEGFWRKPVLGLMLSLLVGGLFRFYNPNWDYEHSFHPDERNILGQTAGIQASNGFRVQFFAYGQLPVFLYRATGELLSTPQVLAQAFGAHQGFAQSFYWLIILGFSSLGFWFFKKEKYKIAAFGLSVLLFSLALLLKFFPVFAIWFNALQDWPARLSCFGWVTVTAFVVSALLSKILEADWLGIPFYAASGSIFLFGVLPLFLPDAWGHTFGATAFTLLILVLGAWLAWVTRWGRVLLAFLALWTVFASLQHGGIQYVDYGSLMIIGRVWAAFFSTATIAALYVLVNRLYGKPWLALLSAACFAFSVVSIQVAHYCITESLITLMLVVVATLACDIRENGSWKSYLLTGSAFGISMAAKTSSLYYLLILLLGHILFLAAKSKKDWLREDRKNSDNKDIFTILAAAVPVATLAAFVVVGYKLKGVAQDLFYNGDGSVIPPVWLAFFVLAVGVGLVLCFWGFVEFKVVRGQAQYWIKLVAAGALSFLMFCLLSPWSLLDFSGFQNSMNYEWHVVSIADACYVLQFKDTFRYLFHLQNLMSVELWWPLGVTVILGSIWVIGRFVLSLFRVSESYVLPVPFLVQKGISPFVPDLMLLIWFIPYFGFIGAWNTKFIRYMVPLIPFFCIFGARLLTELFDWLKKTPALAKGFKIALLSIVLGGSLFYSTAYMHVYRFPHPWLDASVWIYKNVPPGSLIFNEAWGDGLPVDMTPQQDARLDHFMSPSLYRSQDITPYEMFGYPTDDSPVKRNYYANTLQQGDYISISSKKLWYTLTNCTPEFKRTGFNAYPITSRYYRLLWSGLLGYKMVGEFHNFPSLFGWEHPDDMAEESFSVYDHPRVYIFKKFETVPPDQILKLLDSDDYVKGIDRDVMRTITPENVDAFIAGRQKYLSDNGLLQRLAAAPASTGSLAPTPVAKDSTPLQRILTATAQPPKPAVQKRLESLTPIPTPEPTIVVPLGAPGLPPAGTLQVLKNLTDHPVTETDLAAFEQKQQSDETLGYQIRAWLSWLLLIIFLGLLAFPLSLKLMESMPAAAYSLSKILGMILFAWLVWISSFSWKVFSFHFKIFYFSTFNCWAWILFLTVGSGLGLFFHGKGLKSIWSRWHKVWLIQDVFFIGAFALFTLVRVFNPHIHDPSGSGYNGGGEAGMDLGFLSSVVRGDSFPPQNMWMAGQPIGYPYYFGHILMGILTKTLGLAPAVTYNLAIITLFALIFSAAFSLAYALSEKLSGGIIAGLLCATAGNLDGAKQYLRDIGDCLSRNDWTLSGLWNSTFDYWGPSRVIPHSINEFPYFSVLFADMHAHTLAMPFAMLLVGLIMSFYFSNSAGTKIRFEWPLLLGMGFLLGGLAFLNTWDTLTWSALLVIALLLKMLASFPRKTLVDGFKITATVFGAVFVLLAAINKIHPSDNPAVLGGTTTNLEIGLLAASLISCSILYSRKITQPLSIQFLICGLFLAGVGLSARVLWDPFFSTFVPQQSKILWVLPYIRTAWGNYFTIYGAFLSVMVWGFLLVYAKPIGNWIGKGKWRISWDFEGFLGTCEVFFQRFFEPQNAVQGMFFLGLALCLFIIGGSWIHWVDPQNRSVWALLLAAVIFGLLILPLYLRKIPAFGAAAGVLILVWVGLIVTGVFPLFHDSPLFLGLGLFSAIWILGFLNLGLAVQAQKDKKLSFAFILIGLFFLVTATLEIFAISEYMGDESMRNNTLFKFGIDAWILASIATGALAPRLWNFASELLKSVRKETKLSEMVLAGFSFVVISWLLHVLLDEILFSRSSNLIYFINLFLVLSILAWIFLEDWLAPWIVYTLGGVLFPVLILPLLPNGDYTSLLYVAQRFLGSFDTGFLFPASLVIFVLIVLHLFLENKKNKGMRIAVASWKSLAVVLSVMVLIYPLAATFSKCRQASFGSSDSPTLNGLTYLKMENPGDAAAIRFLNETVPGQPCLIEAVGLGYNTWGSRYSIFTGIPALMGWDGHVREWVGSWEDAEISQRYSTTETIFNTHDVQLAKNLMDAYGVRLIVIGPLERGEEDPRKRYDPDGLAKFSTFLPLIYKNPKVEIYYNPPAEKS